MGAAALGIGSFGLVVIAVALWFRCVNQVALEGRRAPLFTLCAAGAGLGVVALASGPGWVGGAFAALAVLGGGLWIALGVLAPQSKQAGAAVVGEPLPAFEALDHAGERFELGSLAGHPVLIKLFRGHW